MHLGVNLINFGPAATPANLRRWVEVTEGLGYHSLLTSDHVAVTPDVASRYPAPFYEPLTTLGWLAAATSRLRIGATVMILPYRNPLETARAFANLDQLSGGRVIFGAGIGWAEREFAALGVDHHRRGRMTDEYLEAILRLWSDDTVSFDGTFVRFDDVDTRPRPLQQPHPPVWIGGSSEAALRRVVRFGDGWHPIRLRPGWLRAEGIARLDAAAQAAGVARPAVCPRIGLHLSATPFDDDARLMGAGTLDQIRADLAELFDLGCEHVLLDSSYAGVEGTLEPADAWRALETIAADAYDLAAGHPR